MDDASKMITIVLLILVLIVWAGYNYNKRRADAFLAFASSRGYSFSKGGSIDLDSFSLFQLFFKGFEKKADNLISGETDGAKVLIFDYSYKYYPKNR